VSYILHDGSIDEEFESEDAALSAAALSIADCLDRDTGWSNLVNELHITRDGIVTHRTVQVPLPIPEEEQEAMEDDPDYRPPFDFYCDYEMRPVGAGVKR
jgi:hypothetical protein